MSAASSSWIIGSFAVVHFLIVSVAGLAPLTLYLMEGAAIKKNNPHLKKLAKQLLTIVLELAAVGGILGSGLVVALIGLRPHVITLIMNLFFWFIVLQLVAFIAGLSFQFAHYFTWDKDSPRHRLWGLFGAILPLVPFIVFTAGISFLSTPGKWVETGNILHAVFNPTTIVSLLHRIGSGVSVLGILLVILHVFQIRKTDGEEKAYHEYSVKFGTKLALRALEAQVVIGIIRIFVMHPEGMKMIMGGSLTWVWMIGIAAGIIAWLVLFLSSRKKDGQNIKLYASVALAAVVLAVGLMSVTRSKSRGDFSIRDVMTRSDEIVALPANYQVSDAPDGGTIFAESCGACHPGLAGDALALAKANRSDPDDLAAFLVDPSKGGIAMPPFTGSSEALTALVSYMLDIPIEDLAIAEVKTAPASGGEGLTARGDDTIALAWNDLGMHCFMADYSVFQVLPPFNTLWTQVFQKGDPPQIITEGLNLEFSFEEIKHPEDHTNFWDYAPSYGWDLEPGIGLMGFGVSGEMEMKADHFVAEGVPIVDTNDAGVWDPFPMFDVNVMDSNGNILTDTLNVAPVSSEMRCDICHSGGPAKELSVTMENILTLHDKNQDTILMQTYETGKTIFCANCHADPAMGIMENNNATTTFSQAMHSGHAGRMEGIGVPENVCWACHPGPLTECQRGAMSAVGITCTDCHGDMEEVGAASRTPWVNLPMCESCHTGQLTVASTVKIADPNSALTSGMDALYRNRTAHGGIYCAACHGSPHSWYTSTLDLDNEQSILWQGAAGTIRECSVCHETQPEEAFWHFKD